MLLIIINFLSLLLLYLFYYSYFSNPLHSGLKKTVGYLL